MSPYSPVNQVGYSSTPHEPPHSVSSSPGVSDLLALAKKMSFRKSILIIYLREKSALNFVMAKVGNKNVYSVVSMPKTTDTLFVHLLEDEFRRDAIKERRKMV